jgi:hypothetical protein
VLLSEETNAVDYLLGAGPCGFETAGESGVLALQKLDALGGHDSLHPRHLETLEARLGLQRPTSEGRQLVTEMLDQLLQLRKCGSFRTYAV